MLGARRIRVNVAGRQDGFLVPGSLKGLATPGSLPDRSADSLVRFDSGALALSEPPAP